MKLTTDQKLEIQAFIYFLFRGNIDPRLINSSFGYLDLLLKEPELLYNCFQIFAYSVQTSSSSFTSESEATRLPGIHGEAVANYILTLNYTEGKKANSIIEEAKKFNKEHHNLWSDFLTLAQWFCFNTFPDPVTDNYLPGLHGCGTDGVTTFVVWTNVIEVDEHLVPLNSVIAFRRANERIKLWDNKQRPDKVFEEWELEQELY